jgi:hypothetical protein
MKTHKEQPDAESELAELSKLIETNNNEVIIYIVHPTIYGPIRGLHFILTNPNPKELNNYLQNPTESFCKNLHSDLGLVVTPMVSDSFKSDEFEETSTKFNSLESAEEYILAKSKTAPYKDPFYYRKGIL